MNVNLGLNAFEVGWSVVKCFQLALGLAFIITKSITSLDCSYSLHWVYSLKMFEVLKRINEGMSNCLLPLSKPISGAVHYRLLQIL